MQQALITEKVRKELDKWLKKTNRRLTYTPFVGIRDTWRVGRRHFHLEPGTQISHVSASDLELRAMTYLRFYYKRVSFKTQFPLVPLEKTIEIANSLGVVHPRDWTDNAAQIMSTDIIMEGVDRKTNQRRTIAVFVRYMSGLYKMNDNELKPITREWQKIAIASAFHTQYLQQEFVILTDQELSKETEYSINWLSYEDSFTTSEDEIIEFVKTFLTIYDRNPLEILNDLLEMAASTLHISFSLCLSLFRFCGQKHYLPLDVTQRITLSSTIGINYVGTV
tara:strand:+ start:35 stop:871 length:837 start_codon:yes stop_codon:yes gene_type:complete